MMMNVKQENDIKFVLDEKIAKDFPLVKLIAQYIFKSDVSTEENQENAAKTTTCVVLKNGVTVKMSNLWLENVSCFCNYNYVTVCEMAQKALKQAIPSAQAQGYSLDNTVIVLNHARVSDKGNILSDFDVVEA